MNPKPKRTPLHDQTDPAEETSRSLPTWPDSALFSLARDLAAEIIRRGLPQPAALPAIGAAYELIGAPLDPAPDPFQVPIL